MWRPKEIQQIQDQHDAYGSAAESIPDDISTYEVGKNLLAPTYVGPQQERGCTGNASDKKTQEEVR